MLGEEISPAQPGDSRAFVWEWRLGAPPERLWPLVSDTDRVNRLAGLPRVRYRFSPSPTGGADTSAEVRLLGVFPVRYREAPFEWAENRRHAVRRDFQAGPLRWYASAVELHPEGGSTRLVQTVTVALRWGILGPLLPLLAQRARASFGRAYARLAEEASPGGSAPAAARRASGTEEKALRLLGGIDPPLDPELRALLARHIATAEGRELERMRPFALAHRFGRPGRDVLAACLSAVRAGALDLRWNLLCPHCRDAKRQFDSLSEVTPSAHCDACNIDYEVEFDRSLEVTFRPAPALRRIREEIYCVGGPQNTPHVLQQTRVPPGETRSEGLVLAPGAYRIRCPKSAAYVALRAGAGESPPPGGTLEVAASPGGLRPAAAEVPAGGLRARYANGTPEEAVFILERTAWADDAATALDVAFFDRFRRLFGPEAFRPGERIAVNNVALLFTDLKGSTAMYEQIGDAVAYGRVRDHFGVLEEALRTNRGGLVKTIGDAVMASFRTSGEAVRAAFDIHRGMARFNAERGGEPLVLKMGIHAGHAIAVNLNGRIDFFGRTVNIAARAQEASRGGDVILTRTVFEDPEAAVHLARAPHRSEVLDLSLRGVAEEARLYRIVPSPA